MRRAVWVFSLSRKAAVEQNYKLGLSREKTKPCIIGDKSSPQLSVWYRPRVPERKLPGTANPRLPSFPRGGWPTVVLTIVPNLGIHARAKVSMGDGCYLAPADANGSHRDLLFVKRTMRNKD